jgi:hypothetical protein
LRYTSRDRGLLSRRKGQDLASAGNCNRLALLELLRRGEIHPVVAERVGCVNSVAPFCRESCFAADGKEIVSSFGRAV